MSFHLLGQLMVCHPQTTKLCLHTYLHIVFECITSVLGWWHPYSLYKRQDITHPSMLEHFTVSHLIYC